jgi:cytochrome c oxidase accessory protein FixG
MRRLPVLQDQVMVALAADGRAGAEAEGAGGGASSGGGSSGGGSSGGAPSGGQGDGEPGGKNTSPMRSGALLPDGTREDVQPADVKGRFTLSRRMGYVALIAFWAALPWIHIGGNPAVFLDVERRRFFLFGLTFNAQDAWLLFFLLTGVAFGLIYLTALLGRVFCSHLCPQTVFLDGVYRRIERLVEGGREARRRRNAGPWNADKIARKALVHALYLGTSFLIAHIVLAYFVSLPALWDMMRNRPAEHPEAFAWMAGMTLVLYGNYSWFREQLCLIICPYGRFQSIFTDRDTMLVAYDGKRGEPRGKVKDTARGACVDCNRCVVVCPTGIDIRNGLQLDCIGCTACIDACDEVMDKVHQPRGLVRFASQNELVGEPRRFVRPRTIAYTVALVVGAVVPSRWPSAPAAGSRPTSSARLARPTWSRAE